MHALDLTALVNAASGAFFIALGLFVGSVRSREEANRAFAGFSVAFGVAVVMLNLYPLDHSTWSNVGNALASGATALAVVRMARACPRPLGPDEARLGWLAAIPGVYFVLMDAAWNVHAWPEYFPDRGFSGDAAAYFLADVALFAMYGALWSFLFLLALRFGRTPASDVPQRRAIVLTSVAVTLFTAYFAGGLVYRLVAQPTSSVDIPYAFLLFAPLCIGLTALWLWNAAAREGGAAARNLSWLCLGAALAGTLLERAYIDAADAPGYGVTRVLSILILAYAIVRHQLLGIDVRVKWTISKGTLAAIFIGVFFVASETAQQFFQDEFGSTYLGIAAAGLLVFALSPLQRLADRVAGAAVPMTAAAVMAGDMAAPPPPRIIFAQEEAYRAAVRLALRDGVLSREEERDLMVVAENLGLTPTRAFDLVREVEAERARPA